MRSFRILIIQLPVCHLWSGQRPKCISGIIQPLHYLLNSLQGKKKYIYIYLFNFFTTYLSKTKKSLILALGRLHIHFLNRSFRKNTLVLVFIQILAPLIRLDFVHNNLTNWSNLRTEQQIESSIIHKRQGCVELTSTWRWRACTWFIISSSTIAVPEIWLKRKNVIYSSDFFKRQDTVHWNLYWVYNQQTTLQLTPKLSPASYHP